MKRLWLVCLSSILVGCDGATDVTADTLTGSWIATEFRFTESGNPDNAVDLIADSAMAVTLDFETDLSGQATFVNGGSNSSSSFTWALDGSSLVMWGDAFAAEMQDSETTLTLIGATTHDFDGDGIEEAAQLEAAFARAE